MDRNQDSKGKKIAVFGASGFIGSRLCDLMALSGFEPIKIYKSRKPDSGHSLAYDLSVDSPEHLQDYMNDDVRAVIFSVAFSGIDDYKKQEDYAMRVHVEGIKKIIPLLVSKNILPVFISTDAVFGARSEGMYREADVPSANTVYGEVKMVIEQFLQNNYSNKHLIVRLSKVFDMNPSGSSIFAEWYRAIQSGSTIRCASDHRFSPTYVDDVTRGILRLIELNENGIFHLCYPQAITRRPLLELFCKYLSLEGVKIEDCKLADFKCAEKRPIDSSLDASKFVEKTGFQFTSYEDCFRIFKKNLKL